MPGCGRPHHPRATWLWTTIDDGHPHQRSSITTHGEARMSDNINKSERVTQERVALYNNLKDHVSALMDLYLSHWRQLRRRLNSLPVRHEEWGY
jgi:hypothetical protein